MVCDPGKPLSAAFLLSAPSEADMVNVTHPDKELVRAYMSAPERKESPPPSPGQIKRQLGWGLIPENGRAPEVPSD